MQLAPSLSSNSCVKSLTWIAAEEAWELAVFGRRRLVGGDGAVAEHQGPRAHPWDNSSWHEAARGGPATCAGGYARSSTGGRALRRPRWPGKGRRSGGSSWRW